MSGSKGIGRLSVQFLADEMVLESTSTDEPDKSLYVLVDWTNVIRGKDLDTVNVEWETRRETLAYPNGHPSGTRVTLKVLKSEWDESTAKDLGREVWMLRSPFKQPAKGKKIRGPENFDVEIEAPGIPGARDSFNNVLKSLFSNWKARIRGTLERGRLGGKANISVEFKLDYPKGSEETKRFPLDVDLSDRIRQ